MMACRAVATSVLRSGVRRAAPALRSRNVGQSASHAPQLGMLHLTASTPPPRAFSAIASSDVSGVAFGDLLTFLDVNYGLNSRFVQEPLAELAQILGYVRIAADTVINFRDAEILMEEIGAPPCTPEQFQEEVARIFARFQGNDIEESAFMEDASDEVEAGEEDTSAQEPPQEFDDISKSMRSTKEQNDVHISHKTKLSRVRRV